MHKEAIKQRAVAAIDADKARILALGDELLHAPETAFKEFKSSAIVKRELASLGLPCRDGLAITGLRADLRSGRDGPTVALLAELDALLVPGHPCADSVTGAAHACGHHAQGAAMIGAAIGLSAAGVLDGLVGNIAFIAVPAEEVQPHGYYADWLREGQLRSTSGKAQMVLEGAFDDVDTAIMIHAAAAAGIAAGCNGLVSRTFTFHGRSAHAGLAPENGVNALSMLRNAMAMIDAQRENQNPADHIRIHGVITQGGLAANIIPDKAVLSLLVRARTLRAMEQAAAMTERCARGAALAFGGEVSFSGTPGYLPLQQSPLLLEIHKNNFAQIAPGVPFAELPHRGSSTDMGDISSIMPALHPYSGGAVGTPHEDDFVIADHDAAYVTSAKLLALDTIDLMWGDGDVARALAAEKPLLTRDAYCRRFD